jgi:hypothetical protein
MREKDGWIKGGDNFSKSRVGFLLFKGIKPEFAHGRITNKDMLTFGMKEDPYKQ